jgi:sec-independent protein translocase protein TatA
MPIGMTEILIILFIILLLFGAKKLPELARGLGRSLKEFKDATREGAESNKSQIETPQKKDAV